MASLDALVYVLIAAVVITIISWIVLTAAVIGMWIYAWYEFRRMRKLYWPEQDKSKIYNGSK